MKIFSIRTVLASLGFFGIAYAAMLQAWAVGKCTTVVYQRADASLIDSRSSWQSLLDHHKRYASCDDGALAEGYSDAVVNLFANRWDALGEFSALGKKNPAFQRWAIRHIDATAGDDDLKQILHNVDGCLHRKGPRGLCMKIRHAAENALAEIARSP